jgi:HD-like signal output (HDOD) protein
MLAERWKFPENLVECIRRHHDLTVANDVLAECIYLANTISKVAPNSGSMPQFSIPAEWRGSTIQLTVDEAIASLGDINRFVTEAEMFLQTSQS